MNRIIRLISIVSLISILYCCTSIFSDIAYDRCVVYFDANGGFGQMSPQEGYQNEDMKLKKSTFIHKDYTFAGWSTSPKGYTEFLDEDPFFRSGSRKVYLYAMWVDIKGFMVPVEGAHVSGKGSEGVFVKGREIDIPDYSLSRYEITYEKYTEVYNWAIKNGYEFEKIDEGSKGGRLPGGSASNPSGPIYQPVTNISWYATIAWCNAFSEKENLEIVYTLNDAPYKDSTIRSYEIKLDMSKNGYRLPVEVEWEFAARGGDPSKKDWNYKYPGSDDPKEVCWFDENSSISDEYQTRTVGTTRGTRQNIFDISGNVREWCWDIDAPITATTPLTGAIPTSNNDSRLRKSGSYDHGSCLLEITDRTQGIHPDVFIYCCGFRVARTGLHGSIE